MEILFEFLAFVLQLKVKFIYNFAELSPQRSLCIRPPHRVPPCFSVFPVSVSISVSPQLKGESQPQPDVLAAYPA